MLEHQPAGTAAGASSTVFSMAGAASAHFNVNAIPEPSTVVMLLGLAAGVIPLWRRRARRV